MPEIIDDEISRAWIRAITLANSQPKKEVSNLIVSVEGIQDHSMVANNDPVRLSLDHTLESNGFSTVSTVANTIFPSSLWQKDKPRAVLYERYLRLWPRVSAHKKNQRGTYFQRLIALPGFGDSTFNQLEFVITAYNSGTRRRSALQCGILVPSLDLNATPYQGFPCMQQLAMIPDGKGGLRVSALYPMHYLWARAYGNYLGLINLGRFMAAEMNLELRAMTCIALVAKLDEPELAVRVREATNEIQ
jgi:hypothetical protein